MEWVHLFRYAGLIGGFEWMVGLIFFPVMKGRNRPILLKKSAMVSTAEKYALEIEIFPLCRGFRAQISHSCAQKRRFQQPVSGQSGRTDFFNRIGQKQPFDVATKPEAVYSQRRCGPTPTSTVPYVAASAQAQPFRPAIRSTANGSTFVG